MDDGRTVVTYTNNDEGIKREFTTQNLPTVVVYINKFMTRLYGEILNDPDTCKCEIQENDGEPYLTIGGPHDEEIELKVRTIRPWPGGFAFA